MHWPVIEPRKENSNTELVLVPYILKLTRRLKRGIVVEFSWWNEKRKRKAKQKKNKQKQKNKKGKVEKGNNNNNIYI